MDINSLISQYLRNNSEADLNQIASAIDNLKIVGEVDLSWNNSIFSFDDANDTLSESDFINLMCKATGKSADQIQDDVSILFSILDNEEDGKGSLSKNELSVFMDGNDISKFRIWDKLLGYDENAINQYSSLADNEASGSGSAVDGSAGTTGTTGTGDGSGNVTGETEPEGSGTTGSSGQSYSDNFDVNDPNSVKNYLKQFAVGNYKNATYDELLDFAVEQELMTQDQADAARDSFKLESLSKEERSAVQGLMQQGKTLDEALEILDITAGNADGLNEKAKKEINAEKYADDLYNAMKGLGTDEAALARILNDESISNDDFVKIVQAYESKYGRDKGEKGLVTRLENELSGADQTAMTAVLGERLLQAAEEGNEDAIELICKEVYSGTAGQNCTANDFLNAIFGENASSDTLYKIYEKYGEVNKGHDLISDIKNDYAGIFGWRNWSFVNAQASGDGADMIARIQQAIREHSS